MGRRKLSIDDIRDNVFHDECKPHVFTLSGRKIVLTKQEAENLLSLLLSWKHNIHTSRRYKHASKH